MKAWHEEFPKLLENLIGELENNGLETIINEELLVNGKIELECKVSKNIFDLDLSNDFELIINFPDSFPYFRPEVVAKGISLPRHQNLKTGNLCLIPRPSMYWNVGTSIFDYLKERLPIVIKKGQIIDQDIIALDPDEQAEPISEYFCKKTNTVVLSSRPSIFNRVVPNQNAPFEILDSGNLELFISTNNNNNNKVKLFKTYNETEGGCNYKPMIDLGSEVLRINNLVSTIACSKSSNKSLNSFTGNSSLSSPLSFPLVPSA